MVSSTQSRLGSAPEEGIKAACRVSTVGNITLVGTQLINTVSVGVGDRVLVKAQTDPTENGIYEVKTNAWARAPDMNGEDDMLSGMLVVEDHLKTLYMMTYTGTPWIPGTTVVTFDVLGVV